MRPARVWHTLVAGSGSFFLESGDGAMGVAVRGGERSRGLRTTGSGRIPSLMFALVLLLLFASPASGQRAATVDASVHVSPVSRLHVDARERPGSGAGDRAGVLRIQVRANHAWKVMVAVPAGREDAIWFRAQGGGAAYERLEPGAELVVARGTGGAAAVELEYRWVGSSGAASLPLRSTLAMAEP